MLFFGASLCTCTLAIACNPSAVNLDLLLGDKSLHVFGDANLTRSIQATRDVLMAGGKLSLTQDAIDRKVALLPQCKTPWDFYHGRWVRIAPLEHMFDLNPGTNRPPWTPRASCLVNYSNFFYNNRTCSNLKCGTVSCLTVYDTVFDFSDAEASECSGNPYLCLENSEVLRPKLTVTVP